MPNTDKRKHLKATVIAVAIAVLPLASHAAGLGRITVLSVLGQPLKAELEVTANRDETPSLVAKVAAPEAFRQAGIEYSQALSTLRFSRDVKERGGRRYLEVTSDRPLNEPFIDMLVELSWASGRLVREYTFLLDPPDLAPKAPPVPMAAPVVRTEPAMAKPAEKPAVMTIPAESRPAPESRPSAATPLRGKQAGPTTGNSRAVVYGDTLGRIAAQAKPEGVSLDQMLVALFRSNKDAFVGDNMNRLMAGKILSIPDAETASQVSASEARQEIVAQAADFNAYRKRLAAAAAATEPTGDQGAKQAASGKIAPKIEDKVLQATGKDKLEVSRTETRDAKGKPLQGRIATLEEDLVSRDRALKEASSRIAELEKNLGDLKMLAEMKSQEGAKLQQQAQAASPVPAEAKKPDVPAPVPAAAPVEAAKPADTAKPADEAKPTEAAVAVKPAEVAKPQPKKKVAPPPPPPPEPDFIEENAPLVFGGGAVLALLFGWLGFSTYRKKRAAAAEANSTIAETDLSAHSVFSTTSIAPPPSEQEASQFSSTGVGMAAHQEPVDPVVEADTFLAFGREAQAEEILLDALKTEPQRQAIHMKLLTIYSARKSTSQFESVATELYSLTGGNGTDWEKASAMGAALDPENPLYGSAGSSGQEEAPAEADMTSTTILRAATVAPDQPPPVADEVAPAPDPGAGLDFDLDIGTAAADSEAETSGVAASEPEVAGLDFDLDLGTPEAEPSADAAPQAAAASADVVLDIDFDMPVTESAPPTSDASADMPATPAATVADSGSVDFEFDLGTADSSASEALPGMSIDIPAAEPGPAPLDLGDISLELDAGPTAEAAEPAAGDAADNPEVVTKLELAAAYAEMGDKDGARELLQEALAEGSPAQQTVARAKLDSLG